MKNCPKRIKKDNFPILRDFFYESDCLKIEDVFGKSYGFSVEDKSRKKNYSIRYVHGKGFMNGYIEIKLNK